VLLSLGSLAGVFSEWIATIFTVNFGVSVAAVVLARPAVFKSWVPWVVATLDAGVLLGVMIFGDFAERVSASYTPTLAVSWAMFPLLALAAMRFKPALVLYLGGCLSPASRRRWRSTNIRRRSPRRTPSPAPASRSLSRCSMRTRSWPPPSTPRASTS
jgi:hypothetical protein